MVLNAEVCTIRLPEVTTALTLDTPWIAETVSAKDAFAAGGDPGCYLRDLPNVFQQRDPSPEGFDTYMTFLSAMILSNRVVFYSDSPLRTPPSWQVMEGDCGDVPAAPDIARSQSFINDVGFSTYIRAHMAATSCDQNLVADAMVIAVRIQGIDPLQAQDLDPSVNAFLYLNYDFIAWAAGWRQGMTWTERGELRPPLCHYKD